MTTAADTIAYHRERSWHFLTLVDDELARGELEEASNKLWGAAAHAIKAVAESRGWEHYAHALLETAVLRLIRKKARRHTLKGSIILPRTTTNYSMAARRMRVAYATARR